MKARIGLFHATVNAVGPAAELWKGCPEEVEYRHYVDEGILEWAGKEGREEAVRERLGRWLETMSGDGAEAILTTCSQLTPVVVGLRPGLGKPVVAIDEAMVEEALERAQEGRIGVVATLAGAAEVTRGLLEAGAEAAGKGIAVETRVAAGAFAALGRGEGAEHDRLVAAAVDELAGGVEVVVLAQLSMMRTWNKLQAAGVPVLCSGPGAARRVMEAWRQAREARGSVG